MLGGDMVLDLQLFQRELEETEGGVEGGLPNFREPLNFVRKHQGSSPLLLKLKFQAEYLQLELFVGACQLVVYLFQHTQLLEELLPQLKQLPLLLQKPLLELLSGVGLVLEASALGAEAKVEGALLGQIGVVVLRKLGYVKTVTHKIQFHAQSLTRTFNLLIFSPDSFRPQNNYFTSRPFVPSSFTSIRRISRSNCSFSLLGVGFFLLLSVLRRVFWVESALAALLFLEVGGSIFNCQSILL